LPNKYVPQNPQEFKLETRYQTSPAEPAKDLRRKANVIVKDHHVRKHHAKDVEKDITYQMNVGPYIQKRHPDALGKQPPRQQLMIKRLNHQTKSWSYETQNSPIRRI
jgi:hypothetical protein